MSKEYILWRDSEVYESGGGFALYLPAEAYWNFGMLGGLLSGALLFAFFYSFEALILHLLSAPLALALLGSYAVRVARVNRGGLESLPKGVLIMLILVAVVRVVDTTLRNQRALGAGRRG